MVFPSSTTEGKFSQMAGDCVMSLEEIFREFTPGSVGFIKAVKTHAGMDITNSEIARLASECPDWWSFEDAWENETWWMDIVNIEDTDSEAVRC
jgi:hypothetical protein